MSRCPTYCNKGIATHDDIMDLCEVDELCSGLREGIVGAVHAVRELYEDHHAERYCLLIQELHVHSSAMEDIMLASVEFKV